MLSLVNGRRGVVGGGRGVGAVLKTIACVWAPQGSTTAHGQTRSASRFAAQHTHRIGKRRCCKDGTLHPGAEVRSSRAPLRRLLSSRAHDADAPVAATGDDRVRVLVMQPHFHNYRLRSRRHPLLQLDEAVALAAATPNLDPTAALLVPMRAVAEDMFFTRGKLAAMTELVSRHTGPGPDAEQERAESLPRQGGASRRGGNADAIAIPHPPTPPCRVDAVFLNTLALSPRQQLALETEWGVPVLDRFRVILDIFRARAATREAKLQVELAQIPYLRARLTTSPRPLPGDTLFSASSLLASEHDHRHGHGERQRGGQQAMSGAGETPLEKDRRRLNSREKRLRAELDAIKRRRAEMHKRSHTTHASDHTVGTAAAKAAAGGEDDRASEMLDALTQPGERKRSKKGKRKHGKKKQEAGSGANRGESGSRQSLSSTDATTATQLAGDRTEGSSTHSPAPVPGGSSGSGAHRSGLPVVAVVGYTNAGKTALVRALSGSDDLQPQDMLFATLDTAARAGRLPGGLEAIFVDTVGFVSDLPHQLVEAFKSTLEEVAYADLIIHATDSTDPDRLDQQVCVLDVLSSELHLDPALLRNRVQVNTKIDLVQGRPCLPRKRGRRNGQEADGDNGGQGVPLSSTAGGTWFDWKANMRGAGVVMMNEAYGYFGRQFKKLEVQLQHEGGADHSGPIHTPSHDRVVDEGETDGLEDDWGEVGEAEEQAEGQPRREHAYASDCHELRGAASESKRQQHADLIQDAAALDISVHTGENMDVLREMVEQRLNAVLGRAAYTITYPVSFGQGTQFLHNAGTVHTTDVVTEEGGPGHEDEWTGEPRMKLCVTLDSAALNRVRAFFQQHAVSLGVQEQAASTHAA